MEWNSKASPMEGICVQMGLEEEGVRRAFICYGYLDLLVLFFATGAGAGDGYGYGMGWDMAQQDRADG